MSLEYSDKTKRPIGAERPFPWRCRHCGKEKVVPTCVRYDAEFVRDGSLHRFTIPNIEIPTCEACGQKVFTEMVDAQINAALQAEGGPLSESSFPGVRQ
jgi:hypothetical protein